MVLSWDHLQRECTRGAEMCYEVSVHGLRSSVSGAGAGRGAVG